MAAAVSPFETLWLDDDRLVYEGGVGKDGKIHLYTFSTHADEALPTRHGAGLYGVPTLACEQAESGIDEDIGDEESPQADETRSRRFESPAYIDAAERARARRSRRRRRRLRRWSRSSHRSDAGDDCRRRRARPALPPCRTLPAPTSGPAVAHRMRVEAETDGAGREVERRSANARRRCITPATPRTSSAIERHNVKIRTMRHLHSSEGASDALAG